MAVIETVSQHISRLSIRRLLLVFILLPCLCFLTSACSNSRPRPIDSDPLLGEEYMKHAKIRGRSKITSGRILRKVAMYVPNRLADAVDIFRFDVGVGPSFGYVARITRYGQVGYRTFSPMSFRIGLRGRKLPLFIERSSEFGIGPTFQTSHDREVTPAEIGVGLDLFLLGAYGGISLDECADFVLGFFTLDIADDDWQS